MLLVDLNDSMKSSYVFGLNQPSERVPLCAGKELGVIEKLFGIFTSKSVGKVKIVISNC